MGLLAVGVIGADRPGIVAAVTRVLFERGCNLSDTHMSILRGHFAMMLVVTAPPDTAADGLEGALSAATAGLGLVVTVRPIGDDVGEAVDGDEWNVAVYGADRPGIVHRVTTLLAEAGVNIADLTTRVIGDDDRPVYVMSLDVVIPAAVDAAARLDLLDRLGLLAGELGVSCTARPADADIL